MAAVVRTTALRPLLGVSVMRQAIRLPRSLLVSLYVRLVARLIGLPSRSHW